MLHQCRQQKLAPAVDRSWRYGDLQPLARDGALARLGRGRAAQDGVGVDRIVRLAHERDSCAVSESERGDLVVMRDADDAKLKGEALRVVVGWRWQRRRCW